jgi:hypothetical protein
MGTVTLTIENECDKAEVENNEKTDQGDGTCALDKKKMNLGQLVFKLRYLNEQNALVVTVVQCKGLPARSQNANSDPYVKLVLLPEKQHRTKTRVLRNTRDPVYDEEFTFFGIMQSQLQVRLAFHSCASFITWVINLSKVTHSLCTPVDLSARFKFKRCSRPPFYR